MSTDTVLRNLGSLTCSWNSITFKCTAKNLPSFKDAATWSQISDDPLELTGVTSVGKSEGLEAIELTILTDLSLVYGSLATAFAEGTESSATFTDGTLTVTVPKCTICGLATSGGENGSAPSTTVKLQPRGGVSADMPTAGGGGAGD